MPRIDILMNGSLEICVEKNVHRRRRSPTSRTVSLSYDVASESVIKPCIKNDNQLVD